MAESSADRLDALHTMVEQAKAVPMSASCMINRAEALALIEAARDAVAGDLAEARELAERTPPEVQQARQEAERVLAEARERADQLVEESAVLDAARSRAAELEQQAGADAEGLRREADVFVDGRIAAFEAGLQKTLSQVQTMRARLAARSGLDAGDAR
ncbi:hypothetical protein [Micropruina sonneratiae]|uniref:hypothetical protein n=1 Tax=Micropruina sonneratiae TaxID=2986940 RepID=UPI002226BB83|nr:hypothetical protein [Micropruina sp. KQZ13P-5]MCW3157334.1 hypothetical protein [Micropruina sp. KQZ13P-5]